MNIFGVDTNALWDKTVNHNAAADVIPGRDHVGLNGATLLNGGGTSAIQSTDAYAPGGSKYASTPNPTAVTAPSSINLTPPPGSNGTGGAGAGTGVNQALVDAYLSQIGALPETLQNLLNSNQGQFDSVTGGYRQEFADAGVKHDQAVTTNEHNRGDSIQAAQIAAALGSRGLKATLAAMGSLGGTGGLLADRAVAQSANSDIGSANKTFDTNATSLDNTWTDTTTSEARRQEAAKVALENANTQSRGDVASQHQNIYAQMAGLYGGAGDTAHANEYTQKGIAEQPTVTASSRTVAPSYDKTALAFTPGKLAAYLGGKNDMSVNVDSSGNGTPQNMLLTSTKKRDPELA